MTFSFQKSFPKILFGLFILIVSVIIICVIWNILSNKEKYCLDCTKRGYASYNMSHHDPKQPRIDINRLPTEEETDFDFKRQCRLDDGTIYLYKSADIDNQYSGTMLACEKRIEYGSPEVILNSEIMDIISNINNDVYKPKNEKERLVLYFKLVYPNSTDNWKNMSLEELQDYYQDLEFYYKLPPAIMPQTEIVINRDNKQRFYRVPKGVILDQDPHRLGVTTSYIEVTHFGPTSALLRKPRLFNGTYYYPAKGSGLYLPVGETLIAYNKVHALKMLDVLNKDIVVVGGRDFQTFLKKDSDALWEQILQSNPNANREDTWVKACVVDKHATEQDPNCSPFMGTWTKTIEYIPAALDLIIEEMVSGKSLRMDYKKQPDKSVKLVKVYYGLGDTGDKLLAQIARNRSYDSLQFLREAQMSLEGDAIVGTEYLHLVEPIYSQTYLMRLDPFSRPYDVSEEPNMQPHIKYLLDNDISPVKVQMLTQGVFDPWEEEHLKFDVIVPPRNASPEAPHKHDGRR